MTFPLVLGGLLVGAIVIAALRQELANRSDARRLELGVKKPTTSKNTN